MNEKDFYACIKDILQYRIEECIEEYLCLYALDLRLGLKKNIL